VHEPVEDTIGQRGITDLFVALAVLKRMAVGRGRWFFGFRFQNIETADFSVYYRVRSPALDPGPLPTSFQPPSNSCAVSRQCACNWRITSLVKNSIQQLV
jgi:hypothetical protein